MLELNLEYYRAFYYAKKLGSVSRAAEALFLSQPAVTRSIKKLEEFYDCALFVRSSKGITASVEGEMLFSYVDTAFGALIDGEKNLKNMLAYNGGTLEIAATETPLYSHLLSKIEQFKQDNPHVNIRINGSHTRETIDMVRSMTADLAFCVSPIEDTGTLKTQVVSEFSDIFIAGESFSQLKGREVSLKELTEYPIVTVAEHTSARGHIDNFFASSGIILSPDYTVRTSSSVLPFVEKGIAVGIVPEIFAESLLASGKVFRIQTEKDITPRSVLIVHRDESGLSHLARQFIDLF